jgi:hypothetical protein
MLVDERSTLCLAGSVVKANRTPTSKTTRYYSDLAWKLKHNYREHIIAYARGLLRRETRINAGGGSITVQFAIETRLLSARPQDRTPKKLLEKRTQLSGTVPWV